MMQHDQPTELRDYLTEAEAVVSEWYSRDGLEPSHETNIDYLATLAVLNVVMQSERPFNDLKAAMSLYLVAAFQMGRACGNCSGDSQRHSQ